VEVQTETVPQIVLCVHGPVVGYRGDQLAELPQWCIARQPARSAGKCRYDCHRDGDNVISACDSDRMRTFGGSCGLSFFLFFFKLRRMMWVGRWMGSLVAAAVLVSSETSWLGDL